jgi:MFS family permease
MSAGRGRVALLVALGVDMAGNGLFIPLSLLYFSTVAGVPLSTVGPLLSVATIAALPVPLLVGRLIDRVGPRRIVTAAQVLQAAGYIAYAWSHGPVSILVPAMVTAIGQRIFWSSFFTLVAETAEPGREGEDRTFAQASMVQAVGIGVGALAAGFALTGDAGTYRLVVAVDAATFVVSALLLLLVPVRTRAVPPGDQPGGYRDLVRDRPFLVFTGASVIFALCSMMLGVAVPVFLVDALAAPKWLPGPLFTFNTVLLAAGQMLVVRLMRRLPRTRALGVGGLFMVIWLLALAAALWIPGRALVPYLAGTMVLYAAGELIYAPIANAQVASFAPEHLRGRYMAVYQYGFAIAQIIAPAFFTTLYGRGPAWPFLVLAVLTIGATVLIAGQAVGAQRPEASPVARRSR